VRTPHDSAVLARPPVVAALDMGYGHLRAAAAVASACGADVVEADRPPFASDAESELWRRARTWYEALSRGADAWYAPGARALLDVVTGIPAPDSRRDHSSPNLAARQLDRLVRDGMGARLAARLRDSGEQLVATFYAPAIAADAHGAERVHLVVTDSDVNRVWVPADARRSRIVFFAPAEPTAARLASYGVDRARIRVTGFPLPPELVGSDDSAARAALAARLARLDPRGAFRAAHRDELSRALGDVPRHAAGPPTVVFAVGGAGAQSGVARTLLRAWRRELARDEIRLVLVAGTRPRVAARFERWLREERAGASVRLLFETSFPAYYRRFNETLAAADVLWTKPSELTFYAALGLPLVLARPLGVHERRNRDLALSLGAGVDGRDSRTAAQRLTSQLADGTLAAAAWAGFTRMTRAGARRIAEELAQPRD
jgi:hypothetical protein